MKIDGGYIYFLKSIVRTLVRIYSLAITLAGKAKLCMSVLDTKQVKLTKRRKSVLDFIEAYIRLHGVSPSYEAIALGVGLSAKANAHRIVKRLEIDGFVTTSRRFYSIRIASLPPSHVSKVI
jgi:hypothetical protein